MKNVCLLSVSASLSLSISLSPYKSRFPFIISTHPWISLATQIHTQNQAHVDYGDNARSRTPNSLEICRIHAATHSAHGESRTQFPQKSLFISRLANRLAPWFEAPTTICSFVFPIPIHSDTRFRKMEWIAIVIDSAKTWTWSRQTNESFYQAY